MAEKMSFLRRVFSFGSSQEEHRRSDDLGPASPPETAVDPTVPAPLPLPAEPESRSGPPASDADALLTGAEYRQSGPGAPRPAKAVIAADAQGQQPLPPEAPEPPEPEADFSWLDGDLPPDELSPPEPVAEPSPVPDAVEAAAEAEPTEDADFGFLDPDAPLPAEETDGDFSFLDPDAPVEDDMAIPGADTAGAGGSAGPAGPGWHLRQPAAPPSSAAAPVPRVAWFERLREGLARSSGQLSGSITSLFTKRRLDEATLQEFEDVLIQADLGLETALRITGRLSEGRFGKEVTGGEVRTILAEEVEATLRPVALPLELDLEKKPHVILVVGVNGTGKTTTIGKLAAKLARGGLKVTLCAGDTFRAAAVEQLKIWGERTGSEVIARQIGADAAGLAFEAYDAAVANGSDVLIIDTAGRLQNRTELMAELEKIVRVLRKREPDAPHTVLQTLDATTGQNALSQVEIFRNVAGVNGLVMTKLDGTARGGILVAIAAKYRLPVYFIGVGEGIDDLEPFAARDFAMAIAGKA